MPYVIRNGLAYWEDDFPTEDTADEPTTEAITEAAGFECGECGREYKTRNGLDKHLTTH